MEQEPIPPFPTPLHNQDGSMEDPRIIRAQLESTIRYAEAILRRLDTEDQPLHESTTPDSGSSTDTLTPELVEELDRELSEAFEQAGEQRGGTDADEEQAAAHSRAPLTFSTEPVTEDDVEKLDNGVAGIADSSVVLEFKDGGYTSKFKPKGTLGLALPS